MTLDLFNCVQKIWSCKC